MTDGLLSPIAGAHNLGDRLGVVEWCEQNIDFARCSTYDTPRPWKYSVDDMPYMREIMEAQFDPSVREIVVLKCSRAGITENAVFMPMRFRIARDPDRQLYVGPQEEKTKELYRERMYKGLQLASETKAKLTGAALDIENFIDFRDSTLTATHNQDRSISKGSGWPIIYADEVSQYKGFKVDMLRERAATYRWAHILWCSSPDPEQARASEDDPIFILFDQSDKRYWMMRDRDGSRFRYVLGTRESVDGLRWSKDAKRKDGTWDLNRVAQTAHYVTPSGTVIYNDDRLRYVKTGEWISEVNEAARPGVRGYHLNRFHVPFASGDFGDIAVKWLSAVKQGQMAIRTFRYEIEAVKYSGEVQIVKDDAIKALEGQYERGQCVSQSDAYKPIYIGKQSSVLVGVDVQQASRDDNLYWTAREFIKGGDSGLVDHGTCATWDQLKEASVRHRAAKVICDIKYEARAREVREQCVKGVMRGMIPCIGSDTIKDMFRVVERDMMEGTPEQGRYGKIPFITFHPDMTKDLLFRLVCGTDGHKFYVFRDIADTYKRHMTSERNINGRWVAEHKDNHWRDCEVMTLMLSVALGIFSFIPQITLAEPAPQQPRESVMYPGKQPEQKPTQQKQRVVYRDEGNGWDD